MCAAGLPQLQRNICRVFCPKRFFFLCLAIGFAFYDLDLFEVAVIQACTVALSTLVTLFFAKKYLVIDFTTRYEWLKKLYAYGKYTFGTNISSMVVRNLDSWMLGTLLSPTAVALYNPAIRIANLFEIPATSLASVAFPQAVKRIDEEGTAAAKKIYEKSSVFIFASILPFVIFVLIFAEEVVVLIAGEEYLETASIIRVTILYGLVIPFNKQFGIVLDAMGKARLNMLYVIRNAVINMVLNYFFIKSFGVIGAAYATLSTFIISSIINQGYMYKHMDVRLTTYPGYFLEFYKMMYALLISKIRK